MPALAKNRAHWNETSDAYQAEHGTALVRRPLAWGVWRIPESELQVLGDLEGRDVLELGCGAAQWTIALRQLGARAVGIDVAERQLAHARRASSRVPIVQGAAQALPFPDRCFDVVFCDHGGTTFAPPDATVAEASRVLKPDGLFAFCMATPMLDMCWDARTGRVSRRLARDYFSLATLDADESVTYQQPYGAWIRLFRQERFIIEDLVELRPSPKATTTYTEFVPHAWASMWPAEHIWKVRKQS